MRLGFIQVALLFNEVGDSMVENLPFQADIVLPNELNCNMWAIYQ